MTRARRQPLPARIEPDAIIEALVELRFQTAQFDEVVVGRLIDDRAWSGFAQARTPIADIPAPVRDADAALRFHPTVELRSPDGSRVVKIGRRVISYHVLAPYPGWPVMFREAEGILQSVSEKVRDAEFQRAGLRYLNVFRPELHFVQGVQDTNLCISLDGRVISEAINVNYNQVATPDHHITTRVATPEFVRGGIPPGFSLFLDIDVHTPDDFRLGNAEDTRGWLAKAREVKNSEFFGLLPERVLIKLMPTNRKRGRKS